MQAQNTAGVDLSYIVRDEPSTTAWRSILRRDPCVYCGESSTEIDHIACQRGGATDNDWPNLSSICRSCNRRKRASSVLGHLLGQPVGHDPEYRPAAKSYGKRRKNGTIFTAFRVPPDVLKEIDSQAQARGLSRTEYILRASLADHPADMPIPPLLAA